MTTTNGTTATLIPDNNNNDESNDASRRRKERRKRRWGDASSANSTTTTDANANGGGNNAHNVHSLLPPNDGQYISALQRSIGARLAAVKAARSQPSQTTVSASAVTTSSGSGSVTAPTIPMSSTSSSTSIKRAKVYDLDMIETLPVTKRQKMEEEELQKKAINPYLAHLEATITTTTSQTKIKSNVKEEKNKSLNKKSQPALSSADDVEETLLDERLAGGRVTKNRASRKTLRFVEPGTFVEIANRKRERAANAEKSGFVSGRKEGEFVKSKGFASLTEETESKEDDQYYGADQAGTSEFSSDPSLLDKVLAPRADATMDSIDGSTAGSGGVVVIPQPLVMEWWDVELLPQKLKKEVVQQEGKALVASTKKKMNVGNKEKNKDNDKPNSNNDDTSDKSQDATIQKLRQKCYITASVSNCKTYNLVQHPVPIVPPHYSAIGKTHNNSNSNNTPTLHLTKKERKRQRKLRRAERQRDIQDQQAAGLLPPPEPRLTLSNFMKVLGDQAVMDPSQMEARVNEQIQARKIKHERMNEERKLTKEQRAEKRTRKLEEDTSLSVSVALFLVKDTSHKYHRTKIDLNAQQNNITGGVLECQIPKMSLIICEGGPKAIKRYTRLMMVRMKWRGENFEDEDADDDMVEDAAQEGESQGGGTENSTENSNTATTQKFNPKNTCELVWTGMLPKRMFNSFVFQSCSNSDTARKVLEAKGVAHFWDQVMVHRSGTGDNFHFKLGNNEEEDEADNIKMDEFEKMID